MKINKTIIFGISIFALALVGCQKNFTEPVDTKAEIIKQPIEKQREYVRENFKVIMKEMSSLFKEDEFRELIANEVAKKFDGDYNVLIKTLLSNPTYGPRLNSNKMRNALDAFRNINGENLYPQIYIPFFEKHRLEHSTGARGSIYGGEPQFVLYDGYEGITTVPCYIYNEEGNLEPIDILADEQYALDNELYIISINESVEDDGELPPVDNSTTQSQSLVNFRIKDLTIKDRKESWLGGASEIHIKSNGTTWSHILSGNTSGPFVSIPNLHYTGQTELKGHEIKKIPRGEIGYPILNINYPMNTNWEVSNYFTDAIVYTYVIFEYDNWPAGPKVLVSKIPSAPNPDYGFDVMNFRSSNTPYGGIPTNSNVNYAIYGNVSGLPSAYQYLYYDGHHINTGDIEFNTVKY